MTVVFVQHSMYDNKRQCVSLIVRKAVRLLMRLCAEMQYADVISSVLLQCDASKPISLSHT
jgi:hypothetical protein